MVATKPASLFLACLNSHMSKHTISAPVMSKTARNRNALHDVLAQGASNRDITVIPYNHIEDDDLFVPDINHYVSMRKTLI